MKVPNYQQQVSYQRPTVRAVTLAQPVKEAIVDNLEKIAAVGNMVRAGMELPAWYQRVGGLYGKNHSPASEKQTAAPEMTSDPAPASAAAAGTEATLNFSNPDRRELLAMGRSASKQAFSGTSNQTDAVEKLDAYFTEKWQAHAPNVEDPDQSLLAQDYVVLRREMQHLQAKEQQQLQQENFQQSAGNFIQTAALISQPKALETYIQSNLTAAQEEALQQGLSATQWKGQEEQLYTQAVSHNVQAALQAGELQQAQAVYTHFSSKLPSSQQQLLQEKIAFFQTEKTAQQQWAQLQAQYGDEQGHISPEHLSKWVKEKAPQDTRPQELKAALQRCARKYEKQFWQAQAQYYEQCLHAPQAAVALQPTFAQTPQQWRQTQQLVRAYEQDNSIGQHPEIFNALYEQILFDGVAEKEIDRAFDEREISAADALRLKQQFCAQQAGLADVREKILCACVERLCQAHALSEPQTQDAKYFVYTAGTDVTAHLQAAANLKKLLTLQENIK